MGATDIIRGYVWEDGDVTCLARATLNGSNITQAVISSIARKVFDLDSTTPTTAVDSSSVTVASSVFDTLQTDGRWSKDSTGYNFRDTVAASVLSSAHRYRVEYVFTGSNGEKAVLLFEVSAKSIHSS